jgi:tRNA threonylcarbamoyladenosine modification (KEOPS) complex  Pcc1 subunit
MKKTTVVMGRPKIMQNAQRILVQIDAADYATLRKHLDISVAQFFRNSVKNKLQEYALKK